MARIARRPRSPEASREQILSAATQAFAEAGYHQTSIDTIAARAGLSKGAVYWHFKNKRELFLALLEHFADAYASHTVAPGTGPVDAVRERVLHLMHTFPIGAEVSGIMVEILSQSRYDPELRERLAAHYARWRDAIAEDVQRGIDAGELRDVDATQLAVALTALLDGLALVAMVQPGVDLPSAGAQALEVWLEGLKR